MTNANQDIKGLAAASILPKEADVKKPVERQEEPSEINPPGEGQDVPLEENPIPPPEAMPLSKETEETKPEIKRKPKRRPRPKLQSQISKSPKKWEDKWVKVDGKKVLFVPSGFEIMTKDGWRPIMERADKIQK